MTVGTAQWQTRTFLIGSVAFLAAASAQGALEGLVSGRTFDAEWLFLWRILPAMLWVAAVPLLLRAGVSISRASVGSLSRQFAMHAGLALAWILVSNQLLRLPAVVRGEPLRMAVLDGIRGSLVYGPGALALYAALVLVGRRLTGPRAGAGDDATATGGDRLVLREGIRVHLVPRADVRWVEADADHVRVHTAKQSFRVRGTLSGFEQELTPDGFMRLHRSALVHPAAIREIQALYHGDHVAVLVDGSEVRIPRSRRNVIDVLLDAAPD